MTEQEWFEFEKRDHDAYIKAVKAFIYDESNIGNCVECPYNREEHSAIDSRLPCGQYHCWIRLHNQGDWDEM